MTSVTVCIATFRRRRQLGALLESLVALEIGPGLVASVVVVDNDAVGSGRAACAAFERRCRLPVVYVIEPRRGIPLARNTGVRLARGEWIAFVDDDEVVTPAWLRRLVDAAQAGGADVAAGPVLPRYTPGTPAWVVRGGFFGAYRRPTDSTDTVPYTGNALVRRALLEALPGPFDPFYALTGAEDTDLFLRLQRRGARTVWVDDAVVYETVSASRARFGWLVQRGFRAGLTYAHVLRRNGAHARRTLLLGTALANIAVGLLCTVGFGLGMHLGVRAVQRAARGVGSVLGLAGVRYEEYRHYADGE